MTTSTPAACPGRSTVHGLIDSQAANRIERLPRRMARRSRGVRE